MAAGVSVAVVNVVRLQTEVPQLAGVRAKIKAEFSAREAKLASQKDQIVLLENKLLQDRGKMNETEAKSLQRDIRSRNLRVENASV